MPDNLSSSLGQEPQDIPFVNEDSIQDLPVQQAEIAAPSTTGSVRQSSRGFRFWLIIGALCMTSTLAALENTVVATSLPIIVEALSIGHSYVWVTNAFFLTRYINTVFCYARVSNITIE